MNTATNDIHTMVHMQGEALSAVLGTSPDPDSPQHGALFQQELEKKDDHALQLLLKSLDKYGHSAEGKMDAHLEALQEEFLLCLERLLQNAGVRLEEKLTISLSESNTLLLQFTENDDALFEVLGTSQELCQRFLALRSLAIMSQGLHYMNTAAEGTHISVLPQYKMCLKGTLSHFYLKLG